MKTILFVDYLYSGFGRYASALVREVAKENPGLHTVGLYMEESSHDKDYGFSESECAEKYNYNPQLIFNEFSPSCVVLFAHRFFDYMFTIEAHRRGIPVFNFQHGLYMDSTVISNLTKDTAVQLVKKKKNQLKLYSKCIYYMNQTKIGPTVSTFFDLARRHSLYSVINNRFGEECNADVSFIYGTYWEDFYKEQYKEFRTEFQVVGYPELEGALLESGMLFENDLPVICYLAQTSVEDGIVDKNVLSSVLENLENEVGKFNLILKLHPRSNIELYTELIKKEEYVKVWDSPEFPKCDCYIGHESTVVARALYITNKTLVYRLSEDRISPFEQYTDFVCTAADRFPETLEKMLSAVPDSTVSPEFEKYVYKNPNGSIKQTAQIIMDQLEKE